MSTITETRHSNTSTTQTY